jgi:hypothetical protein
MEESRRARGLLTLTVLLLLALVEPLFGQDGALDADERLRTKLFFVRKFDRCYADLVAEIEAAAPDSGPLLDLLCESRHAWGTSLRPADPAAALEQFERVTAHGKELGSFEAASRDAASIREEMGNEADGDEEALLDYGRALDHLIAVGARESEQAQRIERRIVDLSAREGVRAFESKDYDRAFSLLEQVSREYGGLPAGTEAAVALEFLQTRTGVLRFAPIPLEAEGAPIDQGTFTLSPVKGGEPKAAARIGEGVGRWVAGTYDIEVFDPSGSPFCTLRVELTLSGASVPLPAKVPAGMAYIPAGDGVPAFLIDRTEVTEAEFRAKVSSYRGADARLPAHGVTLADAKRYAEAAGKKLPTERQWLRAVFGGRDSTYPWGKEGPEGRANLSGKVMPVGSFPDGASVPFGLLDAAGSVWEWLRDGYAIGGGFGQSVLNASRGGQTYDFLRDKKPDRSLYDSAQVDQRRYRIYQIVERNIEEVGLRCVIEF